MMMVRRLFLLALPFVVACSGDDSDPAGGSNALPTDDAGQPDVSAPGVRFVEGVTVSTLAGSNAVGGTDGMGEAASFDNPTGISVRGDGMIFVCEYDGNSVRQITPDGTVTTLPLPEGFRGPYANVISKSGELFVQTDTDIHAKKTDTSGTIWIFGDSPAPVAQGLARPRGLGALPDGRIALADRMLQMIKILDPATGKVTDLAGKAGAIGKDDGKSEAARFSDPHGIVAYQGDILVADTGNHRIRRVTLDGTVTTFAGDGIPGIADVERTAARFNSPYDLAVDKDLNVYVTEQGNHRIRRIGADGQVFTIAGDGTPGFSNGPGNQARFYAQESMDISPDGKTLYVADGNNGEGAPYHRIRKVSLP
jgi:DNA-binding beta-propeller fold protein YncE